MTEPNKIPRVPRKIFPPIPAPFKVADLGMTKSITSIQEENAQNKDSDRLSFASTFTEHSEADSEKNSSCVSAFTEHCEADSEENSGCVSAFTEPFKKLKKILAGRKNQQKNTDSKSDTSEDAESVLSLKFSEALDYFDTLY